MRLKTSKNYPLYTDKTWPKPILLGTNNAFRFLLNTNVGAENSVYIYIIRIYILHNCEDFDSQIFLRSSGTWLWISAVHRWFCLLLGLKPFAVNASKTWNPWISPNDVSLLLRCFARPWLQLLPVAAPSQVSVFFVLCDGSTCSFGLRSGDGLGSYRNIICLPWEDLGLRLTVWIGPLSFCTVPCRQIHPATFNSSQIIDKKNNSGRSPVSAIHNIAKTTCGGSSYKLWTEQKKYLALTVGHVFNA